MDKNNKLIRNLILYASGNFGSRILNFLILPLYTKFISTSDMGVYELILAIAAFITPFISFQLNDGVYRWLLDSKNPQCVIKTATIPVALNSVLFIIVGFFVTKYMNIQVGFVATIFWVVQTNYGYYIQVVRGLKHNRLYATIGIIQTFIFLVLNIYEITVLKNGVIGLLISSIASYCVALIIILYKERMIVQSLIFAKIDKQMAYSMIKYSFPLIPNVVCWTVVNMSDRLIITQCLGIGVNGLYAISCKFPSIINMFNNFFYLAWQETAIEEFKSKERDYYYSKIFNIYYNFLISFALVLLPITHVFSVFVLDGEYSLSWSYTGFLYLGTVFSALSSFLGTGYQSSKESRGAFYTTFASALVNIATNLLLINMMGLHAASISTFLAYIFLFMIRIKDTKKYFTLNINWTKFWVLTLLAIVYVIIYITYIKRYLRLVLFIISSIVFIILNIDLMKNVFIKLKNKLE